MLHWHNITQRQGVAPQHHASYKLNHILKMNTVQFECCSLCEGKPLVEPTLASIDINILEKPTYWPYLLKNPRGARWGLLPTLRWVESWLPTYLTNFFFFFFLPPSNREKISQWKSNRQPLHSKLGTSPLSPSNLKSSQTSHLGTQYVGHDTRQKLTILQSTFPLLGKQPHPMGHVVFWNMGDHELLIQNLQNL